MTPLWPSHARARAPCPLLSPGSASRGSCCSHRATRRRASRPRPSSASFSSRSGRSRGRRAREGGRGAGPPFFSLPPFFSSTESISAGAGIARGLLRPAKFGPETPHWPPFGPILPLGALPSTRSAKATARGAGGARPDANRPAWRPRLAPWLACYRPPPLPPARLPPFPTSRFLSSSSLAAPPALPRCATPAPKIDPAASGALKPPHW